MDNWDNWSSIIRSCVLTSKTPLTPYEINRDIYTLEGRNVPYLKFNCRSLEEMLQKISGLEITTVHGRILIQSVPSEETAHIAKMVKLQRWSKKKSRIVHPIHGIIKEGHRPPLIRHRMGPRRSQQFPNHYPNECPRGHDSLHRRNVLVKKRHLPNTTTPIRGAQHTTPSPRCPSPPSQSPSSPPPNLSPKNANLVSLHGKSSLLGPGPASPKNAKSSSSISQRLNMSLTPQIARASPNSPSDSRLLLNSYTESKKLPLPIYKDLPTKNKFIYSSVTVNSKKYSSYPKEAKTKEEAEKLAAKAALDDLLGQGTKPASITIDNKLIETRILKIVNDYPNGLFESSVVECYTRKYSERLPDYWLQLVEQFVTLEVGANNLTILTPQNKSQAPVALKTVIEPKILRLHNMEEFWLHIYVVYNIMEIWGVIIDENHSDKIDELAKEMKKYYDTQAIDTPEAIPGKHYAVFDSEWHRVRCIRVDERSQMACVFFVDRGDEDLFPARRLRALCPKFCQLPEQAVRLSLAGLEIFRDCDEAQTILEDLLVDKDVYVRCVNHDQQCTNALSAQLYLERDDNEIDANELLQNEIIKNIVDPTIHMKSDKIAQDVFISSINEKAVFIQLKSEGLTYLKMLMNELTKEYLNNPSFKAKPILQFDKTKLYLVKSTEDNNWYRVKITKIENDIKIQVFCIDEGNTLAVKKTSLILLEDISDLLAVYPNQAVQVRLHKISPIMFNTKMVNHLRDLAPKTDIFYMKVINSVDNIPIVEFYKRTEKNYLASLNDTLTLEPEIISKDDNNNAKPNARNDRSVMDSRSEFPLKAPHIPAINSYFDVYIVMAAHPGNFIVQPLQSIRELKKLMSDLSDVCESYTGSPITPGSVKVGSMYAVKYDDGKWYRGYVSQIIAKNICAIHFCDYGDYRTVFLENLQPLQNQFYDLPYQAIRAKLFGVEPKLKGDWTVTDSLRFNDLVVAKTFVSVVQSCDIQNIKTSEIILGLELIDTSTADDIYISNILVDENIGVKVEKLKA
ncbi:PREDICTED: tudor domain-containing protein 7B [Ceratosolen solmsi marchali]|uniref:Tudor domain-containing protein 7B n=1 Tax=Ceratosolen solmsi marchali TaxID=326594 RepID=A0AAJ6YWK3_9HYME|nr:PREDICTED: tudor domain-containing protein 7B [Ceratosolen solmsi marchali]